MVRSVSPARPSPPGPSWFSSAGATACGASAGDDKHPDHRSFALARAHPHGRLRRLGAGDRRVADRRGGQGRGHPLVPGHGRRRREPKVTWSMKDDRLTLRMKCSGVVADCAAKHRIEVPRGIAVKVEDGDGSVRAHGFQDALSMHAGTAPCMSPTPRAAGPAHRRRIGPRRGRLPPVRTARPRTARCASHSAPYPTGWSPQRRRLGDHRAAPAAYRVTTETDDGGVTCPCPATESSAHVVSARTPTAKSPSGTAN